MKPAAAALPRLRQGLGFTPVQEGGQTQYILEDPMRHTFYRLGLEEYLFVSRLNESATLEELLLSVARTGEAELSAGQAQSILNWLAARQLLQSGDGAPLTMALEQEAAQKNLRRFSRLNIISFKIPFLNPDPFLKRLDSHLSWLTGPWFFVVWLALGIAALTALGSRWQEFTSQAQGFFAAGNLLILWLIWFGLKLLHELFHALVCRRYGGKVYEAGVLFILFMPMTYVDATSSWTFPSRWQRIHVAVAGMFIELGVAWAAILFWAWHPDTTSGFIAHNTVLIAGISSLLFNANPLMRFDGYYVLSDYLGIPNLSAQGMQFVKGMAAKWFLGIPPPPMPMVKNPAFVRAYGVSVYIWRLFVLVSLGYVASKMAGGLGVFITLGAVLVWAGMPVYLFARRLPMYKQQNPAVIRLFGERLLLTLLGLVLILVLVGWDRRVQAPAVVEYERQYSVRAVASGFVDQIHVHDGQQVKAGELLLTLENSELQHTHRDFSLQLEQLDIKSRLANSAGRQTDFQILQGQRHVLEEELQALAQDIAALRVTAPGDGMVVAAHLNTLQGSFLSRGQDILWIVSPDQKHIAGSASQDDMLLFQALVGKEIEVDMRASGLGAFAGVVKRVEPTVTRELAHPAMGAVYGGPLDVRQQGMAATGKEMEQHFRLELFTPRCTLDVAIPAQSIALLKDGQMATLRVRGDRTSLGSALIKWGQAWLAGKDRGVDGGN
jgi:putative peptide zinc metalloprotease protein